MMEVVVIIVLALLLGWERYSSGKERNKFINALIAKSAKELGEIEFVEKLKPEKEKPSPEESEDLISIDEMEAGSKDFEEVIKQGREE